MSDSTTAFSFTVADNTSIVSSITDAVLGTDSIVNFEGIIGGSGADTLTGGTGSDIIGGGLGNDILDGGAGVDTLDFSYATQGVTVDFSGDTSETSLVSDGQGGTDTVINFENLNGGAGNDYFAGSNVANTASGFVGDDTLIGNAGNDTLYGGDGNDSLSGGEGQDSLYGESGNDTLSGGADIDRIYGGDGNDSIDAGEGNDSIWGDAGNDTLEGGIGRDSIWGGAGNDTLVGTQDNDFDRYYGEAGTDILDLSAITVDINVSTYNGNYTTSYINYSGLSRDEAYNIEGVILGSGNDNFQVQYIVNYENIYVNGGAGNDTISSLNWESSNYYRTSNDNYLGGEGDDYISSFAGTDSLDGGTGNDTLMGGTFNDTIFGGDGDDIIHGGYLYSNVGDDDVLNGGAGIDALDLSNTSDAITLDLSTNWQGQISFTRLGTDTVSNFEGVIGGTNADSITGTDGSDVMGGWSGEDTLIGGAGVDLLQYGTTTGQVEVNLATQTVVKDGNNNVDTISGFENISTGSSNDKVTGSVDNNHIRMNNGNDTVLGSAGNDTLEGGVGTDTLDYTMFSENIVIDRDAGTATFASGKVDVISDFENILLAGGDDTISVALVNDTIDGGDGVDIVTYNAVTQSITVSNFQPGSTTATNYTVLGQTDQLVNIEGISGGQGDDMMSVLATSTTGAILDGFSGNDTLTGGAGSDTISGGAGDDHIVVTLGADSLDGGDGIDLLDLTMVTVDLSVDLATAWQTGFAVTGLGALSISNFEGIQGGAGDDIIAGSADANFIAGGAGADTLSGGAGIDTLSYTTSTAAVNVDLSTNTVIADGTGSVDTITGFENLFGGSSSDTLTGTTGNNIINGNSGNDTIYSMGGADTLDGGAGTDTLSFAGSTDGYVINMNDQTATSGSLITTFSNFENVVGADGNDEILGTNSNSTLKGGAGDDTLVDGSGSDYLYGGEGNDVFVFNTSNQRDYFYGEAGIDLIDFSNQTSAVSIDIEINDSYMQFYINGNWNFAYYIEGAIGTDFNDGLYASTAYGGVYLDGQGGNDTIRGVNNANYQDTLIGGAGNDTIDAYQGDDIIDAGTGNNTVNAHDGNDVIAFHSVATGSLNAGNGVDTIEFAVSETIDFANNSYTSMTNVEIFDLAAGDQNLKIDAATVAAITSGTNSAVDNIDFQNVKILVIDSTDGTDTVDLIGDDWADTGETTAVNGDEGYSIYQHGDDDVYIAIKLAPVGG